MQELNEALKRFDPRAIEDFKGPINTSMPVWCEQTASWYMAYKGADGDWYLWGGAGMPMAEVAGPISQYLPPRIYYRPDPRNEALIIAWEALAFYAQPTETIEGDDPDEPDWPIVVHQWPGNDEGEKAREAQAAILKALEGGE